MSDSIKTSLKKLRESLDQGKPVDEETLALAQGLEIDIQKILDTNTLEDTTSSSLDIALALESRFALEHPIAATCVREIINALHKMGI